MSTQRIYQLLVACAVLTIIAFISAESRALASVLSTMPLNITFALWFVAGNTGGDTALAADFSRMVLLGLIPTALFAAACWFFFRQGWPVGRVLLASYGVWLAAIGVYRGVEWWLGSR